MTDTTTSPVPMQVVELGADNTITLPPEIAEVLQGSGRLLVQVQGNTVILKQVDAATEQRIALLRHLERLANTPDPDQPTLEEINALLHEVRRQYAEGAMRHTDLVANTPETEPPLTLEEINEIVHEVRRQRVQEA